MPGYIFRFKSNHEGGLFSYALRATHRRQGGPESRLQMPLGRVSDSQEASNIRTTGEWAMGMRRSMNHTGVLKVYLIGTRRYAYRLKFVRATVPEWNDALPLPTRL